MTNYFISYNLFFFIASVFSFSPPYNILERALSFKKSFKLYALILWFFCCCILIFSLAIFANTCFKSDIIAIKIFPYLSDALQIILSSASISATKNSEDWSIFYKRLLECLEFLHIKKGSSIMTDFLELSFLVLLLVCNFIVVLYLFLILKESSIKDNYCFYLDTIEELFGFREILTIFIIYKYINCFRNSLIEVKLSILSYFGAPNKVFRVMKYEIDSKLSPVEDIWRTYRNAFEGVQYFNSCFGFFCLMMYTHGLIFITSLMNYGFLYGTSVQFDGKIALFAVLNTGVFSAVVILFILACDGLISDSEDIVHVCYKLLEEYSVESQERADLMWLARNVDKNLPSVSASGFFTINRSSLLNAISISTTYLIVCIQFSGVKVS